MRIEKSFRVGRPRDLAVSVLERDDTLLDLFPETKSEIVARQGTRRTVRSQYRALGRDGVATFHFTTLSDGGLRFEKVCDGNVWKELKGEVVFEEDGDGTLVTFEMDGRTKAFVPEFTIKGPMQDQIEEMARALRRRIEAEG